MHVKRLVVAILAGLAVTGCATIPSGPSVMVLPGTGKSFEMFLTDDAVCRQWAMQQTGITTKQAATQSAVSGAAIGTVVGAAAGAAIGAAAGNPGLGAAVGGGGGLLMGTAVGAGNAEVAHTSVQRRYDIAYMQCMYAKGNQIPVARGSQPTYSSSPAPPPPPPPPSASVPPTPPGVPPPPAGSPPPPPPGPTR